MEKYLDALNEACRGAAKDMNTARVCYRIIADAPEEEQAALLGTYFALMKEDGERENRHPQEVTEQEQKELFDAYDRLTALYAFALVDKKTPAESRHRELWDYIENGTLFSDERTKSAAMWIFSTYPYLPYQN